MLFKLPFLSPNVKSSCQFQSKLLQLISQQSLAAVATAVYRVSACRSVIPFCPFLTQFCLPLRFCSDFIFMQTFADFLSFSYSYR